MNLYSVDCPGEVSLSVPLEGVSIGIHVHPDKLDSFNTYGYVRDLRCATRFCTLLRSSLSSILLHSLLASGKPPSPDSDVFCLDIGIEVQEARLVSCQITREKSE